MGSRSASKTIPPSTRSLSSTNGSHEGDESDEGDEGRQRNHDCNSSIWLRRGNDWIEGEGREGRCRGHCHSRGRPVEEKQLLQARWCFELEAEEEARPTSS